jgi:hypothetical protein
MSMICEKKVQFLWMVRLLVISADIFDGKTNT